MLYSDKHIVISDSIEDDELLPFMELYSIPNKYYTEYVNYQLEGISEPFILIKNTIYRYEVLPELEYVSTQRLLEIVGRKNESKEEKGYPRTKLLLVY